MDIAKELTAIKQAAVLGAKNVLNMDDAVALTGMSKNYLYKLVSQKRIPHYKNAGGKRTFFKREELEAWMLSMRVQTEQEAESAAIAHVIKHKIK